MVNTPDQPNIQFSWSDLLWRLLVTLLLLLALAGPGLSLFKSVTTRPETSTLPPFSQTNEPDQAWFSRP